MTRIYPKKKSSYTKNRMSYPWKMLFGLSKKMKSLQIGPFSISDISQGGSEVLEKLPEWPTAEQTKEDRFDFNLLMKLMQDLMGTEK